MLIARLPARQRNHDLDGQEAYVGHADCKQAHTHLQLTPVGYQARWQMQ